MWTFTNQLKPWVSSLCGTLRTVAELKEQSTGKLSFSPEAKLIKLLRERMESKKSLGEQLRLKVEELGARGACRES